METKWGGFICHIMLGYEKQNKGKNFIMLRNIPVSLETKYVLSSVTIKQMPGKYHKQSIPSSGLLRKATLTGRLTWVGSEPIHKMFRGPLVHSAKVNPI